jgi:type IV pilus assembly protein PilW
MNNPQRLLRASRKLGGGFTLVELLIAITLALLLTVALSSVFLGSRQSFRTNEGVSQVQEEGRFVNLVMAPIVRLAGYLPDPVINQSDPTTIFTAPATLAVFGTNNTAVGLPAYRSFSTGSAVVAGTDVLEIAYVGRNATLPNDTPLKTCLGDDVDAAEMAINVFYIGQVAGEGTPSLQCYTNIFPIGGDPTAVGTARSGQPLVAGVRDMQILYGIDVNGDETAYRYYAADAVPNWRFVSSIQITFTIDSADVVEAGRADTSATNGVIAGRLRRTFTTILQIRNRLRP